MASPPVYYSSDQVRNVLSWKIINKAVEAALSAITQASKEPLSGGCNEKICQPVRTFTTCGSKSKMLLAMPAYLGNYKISTNTKASVSSRASTVSGQTYSTLACKLVTSFSENEKSAEPLPNIMANIMLFDVDTGRLKCIMEATQITAWRTAAASIVATKYLFFQRFRKDPINMVKIAIIGCGTQGQSHALGMCATFNVSHIYLWNRTQQRAVTFADTLRKASNNKHVYVKSTPAECLLDADIVCIATFSKEALIHKLMFQKRSVHINTVGAGEVHYGEVGQDIYDVAKTYIDSWDSAKTELHGLKANIISEVGEVINSGKYPDPDGFTIFQSLGMAVEDATVAQSIYDILQTQS